MFVWKCCKCPNRVITACDFGINERPICAGCNAEMEPQAETASDAELDALLGQLQERFSRGEWCSDCKYGSHCLGTSPGCGCGCK